MKSLPPLRSIQVFETVATCGTVTTAAQILNVSPGAVSQQIRILETALGFPLFERRGRSLRLTGTGKLYYKSTHEAFNILRASQEIIENSKSQIGITLSALPSISIKWLRPLLIKWHNLHPESGIFLIGSESEPEIKSNEADFRITYGSAINNFEYYSELFLDQVVPVCSPSFFKKNEIKTPQDILNCNLIDINWTLNQQRSVVWSDWATFMGYELKSEKLLSFSLSCSALDAAADGEGFVLGQLSMIAGDVAEGRLMVPFDCSMPMQEPYYLAWNRDILQTKFGNTFRSFLRSAGARQSKAVVKAIVSTK